MVLDDHERDFLRALQHPIRLEIYERLHADGGRPQSVEQLAAAVEHNHRGIRTHLRVLSAAGLAHSFGVTGEKWVATAQHVLVPDIEELAPDDPDRALVASLWRMVIERRAQRMAAWARAGVETQWATWADQGIGQEGIVLATPAQIRELEGRLLDVLRDFRARRPSDPDEVPVWLEITAAPLAAVSRGPQSHRPT